MVTLLKMGWGELISLSWRWGTQNRLRARHARVRWGGNLGRWRLVWLCAIAACPLPAEAMQAQAAGAWKTGNTAAMMAAVAAAAAAAAGLAAAGDQADGEREEESVRKHDTRLRKLVGGP